MDTFLRAIFVRQGFLLITLTYACYAQLLEIECPLIGPNLNCSCTEVEDIIDAECDSFSLRLQEGEIVTIRCRNDTETLPILYISEPFLRFDNCPFPNSSYADLILQESVTNCTTFSLRHLRSQDIIIDSRYFVGFNNLTRLDLAFNNLTNLPEDLLINLNSLIWLDLNNNLLEILPSEFFINSELLEVLYLDNNNLYNISENLFVNLSSLWYLSLWNNKLQYVNSSTFVGLSKLHYLDLSHNQLQKLSSNIFNELKSLRYIDLSENYFKRLPITLFLETKYLIQFKINGNLKSINLTDDSEWISGHEKELDIPNFMLSNLSQLKIVSISGSGLSKLPRYLLSYSTKLFELNIRNNILINIPRFTFQDNVNLHILDIGQNNLTELPTDLFTDLQDLRVLRLDNNQLTILPRSYTLYGNLEELKLHNNNLTWLPYWLIRQIRDASALHIVTLAGNPWRCDCRIRDLAALLRNKRHIIIDAEFVQCQDGRKLLELSDDILCNFIDID